MRKVAIPITDTTSWHAFENQVSELLEIVCYILSSTNVAHIKVVLQVKSKLRIRAIQAMTMAAVCCPFTQGVAVSQIHCKAGTMP